MHKRIPHGDGTPGGDAAATSGRVDVPDAIERLTSQLADASPETLSETELEDLQALLDTLAKLIGDD
jgi:hypothetical protein